MGGKPTINRRPCFLTHHRGLSVSTKPIMVGAPHGLVGRQLVETISRSSSMRFVARVLVRVCSFAVPAAMAVSIANNDVPRVVLEENCSCCGGP